PPKGAGVQAAGASAFSPRYCYSYFALYGDPLLDPTLDPYPDGNLARLAASGVDGVWLQAVLTRLAPLCARACRKCASTWRVRWSAFAAPSPGWPVFSPSPARRT